jgi:hypothetical protein
MGNVLRRDRAETGSSRGAGLNWAMSGSQGNAARRRSLIGLSSNSALLSSAALRRANGLDVDERELDALETMRTELLQTVRNLRSGRESTATTPEHTFAFAQLASAISPDARRDKTAPKAEELATVLSDIAQKLEIVAKWDKPDHEVASSISRVFETLSRTLLEQVARPGDTFGRPLRTSV